MLKVTLNHAFKKQIWLEDKNDNIISELSLKEAKELREQLDDAIRKVVLK